MSTDYIIHTRRNYYVQVASLAARYARRYKHKRYIGERGGFRFQEVEDAGVDKSRVDLSFRSESGARRHDGQAGVYPSNMRVQLSAVGAAVRRLTEEDAVALTEIDERIEAARQAVKAERAKRTEYVKAAWRRARKVYAGELMQLADDAEAARAK